MSNPFAVYEKTEPGPPAQKFNLSPQQKALVEQYLELPYWVIKTYFNFHPDHRDYGFFEHYAIRGLLKAAKKYDPQRGVQFNTFAVNVIRNNLFTLAKKYRKKFQADSLINRLVDTSQIFRGRTEKHNYIAELERKLDSESIKPKIEKALNTVLTEREKYIVVQNVLLENKNSTELARELGVTKERIRQIREKALSKLADVIVF